MDPNMAINLGGSLASFTSLAVSLLQWLRSERAAEVKLTVDEYLEWLRRQNHHEILRAIEANEEVIAELRAWIEGIKDSVFRAVLTHETGSECRHRELMEWLDRSTVLDHPRLDISAELGVQLIACGTVAAFSVVFRAVNVSRCHATIVRGEATLSDLEEELRCPVVAIGSGIAIEPNRGCTSFEAKTHSMPLQGRQGNRPKLLRLELTLAQDSRVHTYVPAKGGRLVELEADE